MKIDIAKAIGNAGTVCAYLVSSKEDDDLLPYFAAEFTTPVELDCDILYSDGRAELDGVVRFGYRADCDKCGASVERSYEAEVSADFVKRDGNVGEAYPFDGYELDVTPMLVCLFADTLPSWFTCSDDCKGLCPICGADRNTTDCGHGE